MANARVVLSIYTLVLCSSAFGATISWHSEEASSNDLSSHSAWVWDATACTGSNDPPAKAPYCYSGSKMGEIVTIKVNSFDSANSAGSVLVTGAGLKKIKCTRPFSKAKQLISVEKLGQCLPSNVKPQGLQYCSDQNQVLLDAKVGFMAVQLVLVPAPCPTFFFEDSSEAVLAEAEWAWDSTTCTGSNDPPTHAPFCYSGSKLGERVTIKVSSFDNANSAGSVLVTAAGLKKIRCQRDFAKVSQAISVSKLDECLPSTVKTQGMKFCSDQNKVILDATVGMLPVEMVLSPTACPALFLEESASVLSGEILPSGAQHLLRKE